MTTPDGQTERDACPDCGEFNNQCYCASPTRAVRGVVVSAAEEQGERRAWERAVLQHVLANAPANRPDEDVTPDWIGVISAAMLATRVAGTEGGPKAHCLVDCWCGTPHRREDFL